MKDLYKALKLPRLPGADNIEKEEKPYEGKGERTGTPGHYKYVYDGKEHGEMVKLATERGGKDAKTRGRLDDFSGEQQGLITRHGHQVPKSFANQMADHIVGKGAIPISSMHDTKARDALVAAGHSVVSTNHIGDEHSDVMVHSPKGVFVHEVRKA